ncbi:MAG: hypothetical protein A3B30_00200 [Candidatus Komeilibacteria bacterium RIFCSPLOWO2_01_FULL_52_15]|uniref:D-alanine--D-alanine ligase n=2 Tax=Candidatus Komeiliibacteriota TaxID=1817908 RepID=A0A1G2BR05_9BACT|nr:MAG: hypothetical protein A2677_01770 [Candidatus Komeilibacteria bacterium RIFCSPHIGHO2_01_FULL_52_14]OGY90999.1 MAG: hypothetical protein A3B30_00200 [Candidatus Komeilibacteria bacterium RIFCSPLOWO2_01_FULL_52_15]
MADTQIHLDVRAHRDTVVAVVCGGSSTEAAVSRSTGAEVATSLQKTYRRVEVVELNAAIDTVLRRLKPGVVFPALHGSPGEDGTFQGLLEMLHVPYVGSGVAASATAMNKILAKQLFRSVGIPVAPDIGIHSSESIASAAERIIEQLGTRVVVKPAKQGSAIGVTFANSLASIKKALAKAFTYGEWALVEREIMGREITAGVLEINGSVSLPVLEITVPKGSWYDYKHRYTPGLSTHMVPAALPPDHYQKVQAIARRAHEVLGCRDLSRADFVFPDHGEPVLLEVNTLPGMTSTSLYPDEARAAGIPFETLVAYLVERARAR